MKIDANYLSERIKEAEVERSRLTILVQQMNGAIHALTILLRDAEKPEPEAPTEAPK